MKIEMLEPPRPPHVDELVRRRNKSDADRRALSVFGIRGNTSPKRRKRAASKTKSLFAKANLDPKWEFPLHHVVYRGPYFVCLEKRTKVSETQRERAALLEWVSDPKNYEDECADRDKAANLHTHPVD